eukprot:9611469-Heterocapsa_arctica.AAC.1
MLLASSSQAMHSPLTSEALSYMLSWRASNCRSCRTARTPSRCCLHGRSAGRIDRWPRSGQLDNRSNHTRRSPR